MSILSYAFFRNALSGCVLASVLCGLVGTYVVTRRLAFISGGITHASFGGIGIGVYLGLPPVLSAAAFSVLSACGIQWLGSRRGVREDSAIAVFWTLGMSTGIICSFLTPGFAPELPSYLFGNILTVTEADLWLLGALAFLALACFVFFLRPLVSVAFDAEFARSQGLPVAAVEYGMMAFVALTVVACLRMMGVVLALSLLTIPQVTANIFTHSFRRMALLSVATACCGCMGGLFLSFRCDLPSGASIVFVSVLIYLACRGVKAAGASGRNLVGFFSRLRGFPRRVVHRGRR